VQQPTAMQVLHDLQTRRFASIDMLGTYGGAYRCHQHRRRRSVAWHRDVVSAFAEHDEPATQNAALERSAM